MGRTRPKTRKIKPLATNYSAEEPAPSPSIPALLEKAQALIVQCDYDLARRFVERALQSDPASAEAREMLGFVQLEIGDWEDAKAVRDPSCFPPLSA